ncbi:MAG: IclR family transcriptional regulator, acetate operon repressor [Gaiellaceae bacterium]|nr:IclR family transcriptional regulator, acetate operon repressor [Gaiellaceae bacterium]
MTEQSVHPTEDRYRVQSVERAFALLEALAEAGPDGTTVSELARLLGISKSSTYAILQTLLAGGFVADSGRGMSRRYRLGMALARLGDVVVSQIALRDVAMSVMRDLTRETGLTSRLAVLDEPYAVVIGRVDAPHSTVRFTANLGKREHLHCSAVGKAMLAALPEATVPEILAAAGLPGKTPHTITDADALHAEIGAVARQGYAIDDEEDNEGVFCVGSAVFDHSGRCVAAISVTGLKLDLPVWRVEQIGHTVRAHAVRISTLLGAPAIVEAAV